MKKNVIIFVTLLMAINLFSKDFTLENYKKEIEQAYKQRDEKKAEEIAVEYFSNSDDITVLRNSSSMLERLNPEKCMDLAFQKYKNNPQDKVAIYLYGRITEDGQESILLANQAIDIDADWEYGYRLLTNAYISLLENKSMDKKPELAEMIKKDLAKFDVYYQMDVEDKNNITTKYRILLAQGKYKEAMAILDKHKTEKLALNLDVEYASLYTLMADYPRAYVVWQSAYSQYKDKYSQAELMQMISTRMIELILNNKSTDETVKFISENKYIEDEMRLLLIGETYLSVNNTKKFCDYYEQAVKNGFDAYYSFDNQERYDQLAGNKRFERIKAKARENWDKGKPERKKETLSKKISKDAPATTITDVDGNEYTLESLKGNVLILDFWATWCGPCRMAMPVLSKFVESAPKDVKVISINVWEQNKRNAVGMFKQEGYKMDLAFGSDDLSDKFGFDGIPFLCVIDKEGKIRFTEGGYSPALEENLQVWVEDLLK